VKCRLTNKQNFLQHAIFFDRLLEIATEAEALLFIIKSVTVQQFELVGPHE
jgi:hypothetical protein